MLGNNKEELPLLESAEIKKSFLYIGNSFSKIKMSRTLYKESFISRDLQTAKEFLTESFTIQGQLPDLIILDIPYKKWEHSDFIGWIKSHFINVRIPVIYSETAIQSDQIKELKELNLIDDVVKIENYCDGLYEKTKFLKKTNAYLNHPTTSDKFYNEMSNYKLNRSKGFIIKRAIDIILSAVAIIFFTPLFIVIAIAIKLEFWIKGPVIYSSFRAGRGFKIFKFYKFRSMVPDADKQHIKLAGLNIYESNNNETTTFFKVIDDPRTTKVGSFLRNSSLDELPQLFNVLKGDMSIVGNRPLPLYEAENLMTDECAERFMAPAGITGLWQVSKRGKKNMSTEERISLDINYARNQSLKGDFLIMLKTPTAFIQKSNV